MKVQLQWDVKFRPSKDSDIRKKIDTEKEINNTAKEAVRQNVFAMEMENRGNFFGYSIVYIRKDAPCYYR